MRGQLYRPRLAPILLAIFILATGFLVYLAFYSQSLPQTESQTRLLASYVEQGRYDYVATLTPNLLYNSTSLRLGQGSLFESITKSMNITFTYTLDASSSVTVVVAPSYSITLGSPKWNLTYYNVTMPTVTNNSQNTFISKILWINMTRIGSIIRQIETQTGYSASEYVVNVQPLLTGSIQASNQRAGLDFAPVMQLTLSNGVIQPSGTSHTNSGSLKDTTITANQATSNLRWISLFGLGIVLTGLGASSWLTTLPPRTNPEQELEKTIRPYQELVAWTNTPPPSDTRTIETTSWNDLAKVADSLGKPILHFASHERQNNTNHTFYVLDGATIYGYSVKTKGKTKDLQ